MGVAFFFAAGHWVTDDKIYVGTENRIQILENTLYAADVCDNGA